MSILATTVAVIGTVLLIGLTLIVLALGAIQFVRSHNNRDGVNKF